jgi:hypothetical protein
VTGADDAGGPLDVATLTVLGQRARTHPLVETWTLQPDSVSPRWLELPLDAGQYPTAVESARLDIRWFEGGEYTFHYLETRADDRYQCRWDRHPKPDAPTAHFHPPPDAAPNPEASDIEATHHLGVLFAVLDWVERRVERLHE